MNPLDTIAIAEKGALVVFVVLFAVWEIYRPARPKRTTLKAFDLVAVLNVGVFSLVCKWALTPSEGYAAAPLGALSLPLKIIAALIVIDFTLYWIHRAMHSSLLWNTHRFHHSIKEVNWLKGIYTSGTHISMYIAPQILLGIYVFGFTRLEMALAFVIGYFVQLWQHANVSLPIGVLKYLFVTPQYHRRHHALGKDMHDKNFGAILSVWDVLFGTYAEPSHENYEFGVAEKVPVVRGLLGV
ncbi:MAG: sterol desaturase family protein [Gammaproteobacteria bacterium]|nr:sterol desaturase family protein [Gammaproteobacteria bacterium]